MQALREARSHKSRGIGREGKRNGLDLSFHSLRHTAVSLLKDAGVPDAVVMALVGYESADMSHRDTHVGKEALARPSRKNASRNLKINARFPTRSAS